MSALPANIESARLPETYEQAKTALANCSRLDECQDWADKAEALASYARQADDDTLRKLADRIQARAVRRAGELLKQIDGRGEHMKKGGASLSRTQVADAAGMSDDQRKQAVRVANVPESDFNNAIDGDDPATVTKLADMGKVSRPKPEGFQSATALLGSIGRFSEFCVLNKPENVAKGVMPEEVHRVREQVSIIDSWLDRFIVNLEK